jgi:uncharacterized protein
MATRMAVADAGPLIIWARLGRLDLLREVCDEIWVPKLVEREAVNDPRRPGAAAILAAFAAGILLRPSPKLEETDATPFPTLGAGESAAIRLAIQLRCPVVMDEKRGRSIAKAHHVSPIGTLGILLSAKHQRRIDRIKPILEQMAQMNYFVSLLLRTATLKASGEE